MNAIAYELAQRLSTKFAEPTEKTHQHSHEFRVDPNGRKYTRIVITSIFNGKPVGGSVYCFVDAEGNVFKAAGWKAPAKGIRFNIGTAEGMEGFIQAADPFGRCLYAR